MFNIELIYYILNQINIPDIFSNFFSYCSIVFVFPRAEVIEYFSINSISCNFLGNGLGSPGFPGSESNIFVQIIKSVSETVSGVFYSSEVSNIAEDNVSSGSLDKNDALIKDQLNKEIDPTNFKKRETVENLV